MQIKIASKRYDRLNNQNYSTNKERVSILNELMDMYHTMINLNESVFLSLPFVKSKLIQLQTSAQLTVVAINNPTKSGKLEENMRKNDELIRKFSVAELVSQDVIIEVK